MNYELAKQLKDGGFQVTKGGGTEYIIDGDIVIAPTLSALIEACLPYTHFYLHRDVYGDNDADDMEWTAGADYKFERGISPEEAVAKLWLALHSLT